MPWALGLARVAGPWLLSPCLLGQRPGALVCIALAPGPLLLRPRWGGGLEIPWPHLHARARGFVATIVRMLWPLEALGQRAPPKTCPLDPRFDGDPR